MERIALPSATPLPSDAVLAASDEDRRRHRRVAVDLPVRVVAEDGTETRGRMTDASAGGVGLAVRLAPSVGARLVVYAERLGRLEGRVARVTRDGFVLAFAARGARAKRLADSLTWILNMGPERDRRQSRRYARQEDATLVRADGAAMACRILDISTTGASVEVRAAERPGIGEAITLGRVEARVVRHHESGIGVAFARATGTTPNPARSGTPLGAPHAGN